jgi:hypothetical protein
VIADISASFYQCDSVQPSAGFDTLLTTFVGETADHAWSAMYYTPTGADASGSQVPFAPPSNTTPSVSTTPASPDTPTPTSTAKPIPIGAVVGGAVGGIAIIGAVIAGVVFMVLRSKRKNQNNNQSPLYDPSQGQPPVAQPQQYVPPPSDNRPVSYFSPQEPSKTPIIETNSSVSSPYTTVTQPYFSQNSPVYQQQQPQQPPHPQVMGTPQNPVEIGGATHAVPMHNHEGNVVYEAQG